MVQIKSSVLVAAAAISASTSLALPTSTSSSNSNNNLDLDVFLNGNGNSASPTKSNAFGGGGAGTSNTGMIKGADSNKNASKQTGEAVVDVNVNLDKAQPLLKARRERKDPETQEGDGGLRRSVKEMVKTAEGLSGGSGSGSGRVWKGKASKRGPWRSDGNLIDLNIGHGAIENSPDHPDHLINGNLLDIAIRSPKHANDDHLHLTGHGHEYYRNSGHHGHGHGQGHHRHGHGNLRVHARHHGHGNRHSVVEVIGDGYRHGDGRHGNVEIIDTGRGRGWGWGRHGYDRVDGDVHVHNHVHARSHDHDGVVVVDGDRHRHGDVTVIDGHHHHGDTTIIDGHRHGDTTIIDGHRHGDTTIVNNDRHRGDTTIVNNGHHRGGDTTVVNNHKRSPPSSPKLGLSSKLASLGRAFLTRSHEDRHDHYGDTTIIGGGRHGGATIINGGRHGDTTLINNGRHGDTTLINAGGRHGDTLIVDNDHNRHHHGGDTTIVNNGRHHDTTVVNNGRHHDTTVVNNGRHGDTTVVNNDGHRHHGHGDTTVVNNHKRHHRSDRIIVVGDSRRYRDADFYYKHSWDNGLRYGRPIYFSDGGSFNRIKMVDNDYHYYHGGNNINIIPADAIPYRGDGRYGYGRGSGWSRYPGYYKREGGEDVDVEKRHDHHGHEDVTIVNNESSHHGHNGHHPEGNDVTVVNNHKRHHSDDRDRHDRYDECRHGRCDSRHDGDDVTIVNNHKRQAADVGMSGAPGYIDVTSPVFNSTTATRIASLVLSTSNGTDANSTFVLNASSNIRTQVYLVPLNQTTSSASITASSSNTTTTSAPIPVNLKVPIFVAASASVEPYCATFDPSPENPAPLTVTPCTDDTTSSHESQTFLYNPDTGVIHPDWQPSTDAQQLLQAVPDSVDDTASASSAPTDGDDTTMSAASADQTADVDTAAIADPASPSPSSTTLQAETYAGDSLPTASSAASMVRRATSAPPPSASPSVNSPPPLVTSGPQTSTDSSALPQSNGGASNVTLIFTPSTPAIVNSAAVNFDYGSGSASDSSPDASAAYADPSSAQTQNGMDAQQATMGTNMNMNSKRGWTSPDISGNGKNFGADNYQTQVQSQSQGSPSSDLNNVNDNVSSSDNSGDDAPMFASAPISQAQSQTQGQSQDAPTAQQASSAPASNSDAAPSAPPAQGLHAEANVAINALRTDSLLQKPMIAPESLTAPYQRRWRKAEPVEESAASKSIVA
ncbi:uncharacterized protein I303_106391 [Kwoniella dejecticola CBS 10117]|uniref:Uncharacterized protein n=1 Tax=Kwoniella dejecticola CBS 10117 TaxID=1296121 RepID=A0A1A5ZUU5_9TREE|nr:uncharacterized protein I303_08352 [Kwoniella dejecticola CBS 10117]OBR81581.1 hypothetical protein I303_08352 [Kwoniella dejecticola CBS 10117]